MRPEDSTHPSSRHPLSNGSSNSALSTPVKPAASLTNGSASSGKNTNGHVPDRPDGPFFGHNREEVTRILIQGLTDLGYHTSADALSRESGFQFEIPSVAAFRNAVQQGEWPEAEALLFGPPQDDGGGVSLGSRHLDASTWLKTSPSPGRESSGGLPLAEGANRQEMLFKMRQQKYLELLEERDLPTALHVLRNELAPLNQDTQRLHLLSSLMMTQSPADLKTQAHWDGAAGESRSHLLSILSKSISPSVMIPEHRLAVLLDQFQETQVKRCLYHNTTEAPSLYHDHVCDPDDFPLEIRAELRDHNDEVWYLEFSHDGSMLASTSKDSTVVIYDTTTWRMIARLAHHHGGGGEVGVCYVAWSPDDRYILSCSQGKDVIVYEARSGNKMATIDHFTYPVTTAAWSPDGLSFVIGSQDSKRPLGLFQLSDQAQIHQWLDDDGSNMRVNDCSISNDGSRLAAITMDKRVLVYDFQTRLKIAEWTMEDKLMCVSLSHDGKTLLVSMNEGRLLLLDSETGDTVQRYTGLKQSEFVIRSAFGGAGENFVISGSEDSNVYIWRKQTGQQVAALEAHSPGAAVNSVAWHPTNPAIFASAGDDRKVKIWSNGHVHIPRPSSSTAQLGVGRSFG
ncbi:hypothetical protein MBLNU459_g1560t1 [Dothideomycetes sp. NU459]